MQLELIVFKEKAYVLQENFAVIVCTFLPRKIWCFFIDFEYDWKKTK